MGNKVKKTRMDKVSVVINGFVDNEQVNQFRKWFSKYGEESFGDWLDMVKMEDEKYHMPLNIRVEDEN